MAMIKCKGCSKEISSNAKVCPHCGEPAPKKTSLAVWLVVGVLVIMGINGSIGGLSETAPSPKEEAKNLVKIEKYDWEKGGFGNVLKADFVIKNDSEYTVKDIEIICDHYGKSGTKIDSNKRVINDIVEAKSTITFKKFNMGLINSQVDQSSCEISDFQI